MSHVTGGVIALVIGYGNTLRGDDAVGPCVASTVASWGLPGVRAVAVPLLTPELSEALADAELAIFVDACPASEGDKMRMRCLEPADAPSLLGHASEPRYLLGLARALY